MQKKDQAFKLKSRKLGNEWGDWEGSIEENKDVEANQNLFIFLLSFIVFIVLVGIWLIYLLLNNIQYSTFSLAHNLINFSFISLTLITAVYFILILLTLKFKKPYAFFLKDKQLVDLLIIRLTLLVGIKLNFSKDQIINSMLKVSNSLTKVFHKEIKKEEMLILVPRCLSKGTRKELDQLTKEYDLKIHIASGGTQAREILKKTKPKGIVATACERDLYAGAKDVPSQIQVLAIPNKRPNGPCKNTLVDINEFRSAIDFFLKHKE